MYDTLIKYVLRLAENVRTSNGRDAVDAAACIRRWFMNASRGATLGPLACARIFHDSQAAGTAWLAWPPVESSNNKKEMIKRIFF